MWRLLGKVKRPARSRHQHMGMELLLYVWACVHRCARIVIQRAVRLHRGEGLKRATADMDVAATLADLTHEEVALRKAMWLKQGMRAAPSRRPRTLMEPPLRRQRARGSARRPATPGTLWRRSRRRGPPPSTPRGPCRAGLHQGTQCQTPTGPPPPAALVRGPWELGTRSVTYRRRAAEPGSFLRGLRPLPQRACAAWCLQN